MPLAFASIAAFAKRIPWQAYAAIGAALLLWATYSAGVHHGKQVILARLEKAEALAEKKAVAAATSADKKQQAAAVKFEAEQDALGKAIDEAEANDGNALDALFGE